MHSPTSVADRLEPMNITGDEAVKILRRKIGQRLKGGPHGLMRCWIQFRALAGSTKEGITYEEFQRGLKNYDVILDDATCRQLFKRMDKTGDGHIQISEFVDQVMGRWSSDANTFVDAHVHRGRGKMVEDAPHAKMTADEAILHLRRKISQRLKSGPYGLMRCWIQFRERAGSTKEGITYDEFKRGLKNYDVLIDEAACRGLFARMDRTGDGHIQMREFVDHVMGRWSSDANNGGAALAPLARAGGARAATAAALPGLASTRRAGGDDARPMTSSPVPPLALDAGGAPLPELSRANARRALDARRKFGHAAGVDTSAARSLELKMPRSPSQIVALHRALHAAEGGAGKTGTLRCRGAFARVLRAHGVELAPEEAAYVCDAFGIKSAPASAAASARRHYTNGGATPPIGNSPPSSVRSTSRLHGAVARARRFSEGDCRSTPALRSLANAPAMARNASAPGELGQDVAINYGAFIRHFTRR